jgi:hypothetical protein
MEKEEEKHWSEVQVAGCGIGHRETSGGSESSCGLAVVLSSGRRIEVGSGFDTYALERLVSALERM